MAVRPKPTNNRVVTIGELLTGEVDQMDVSDDMDLLPDDGERFPQNAVEDTRNDIERIMAEIGGLEAEDAYLTIWRADPENKKNEAYLFRVPTQEFNLDTIGHRYGGGKFRIRGYGKNSDGKLRLFVNRLIDIEAPLPGTVPPPKEAVPKETSELTPILLAIQENQRAMTEALARVGQQNNNQSSMKELLETMMMLKEFMGGAVPAAPPKDTLSTLKEFMEMKTLMEGFGSGEGGSTLAMLGMKALDKIGELQKNAAVQPIANPPQPIDVPSQYPTPAPLPSDDTMKKQEQEFLNSIVNAAEKNEDVQQWADVLYDNLPDAAFDIFLNDPQWLQKICFVEPRLKPHGDWLHRVNSAFKTLHSKLTVENNPGINTASNSDAVSHADKNPSQ